MIPVHEPGEIRSGLPVGHRIAVADCPEDLVRPKVLPYVRRCRRCQYRRFLDHRVSLVGRARPFSPGHHVPEPALDPLPDRHQAILRPARGRLLESGAEPGNIALQAAYPVLVLPEQEAGCGNEVLVVVLAPNLRVRGVELVRRRGQQQHSDPASLRGPGAEHRLRQFHCGVGSEGSDSVLNRWNSPRMTRSGSRASTHAFVPPRRNSSVRGEPLAGGAATRRRAAGDTRLRASRAAHRSDSGPAPRPRLSRELGSAGEAGYRTLSASQTVI